MRALLRAVFELFGAVVAPHRCAACDQPAPMMTAFCSSCAATLTRAPYAGPRDLAPFLYGGALARAIARFKYEGHPELARPLSAALRRAADHLDAAPDRVVPVPLYPARLVARGYNQAALLAGPLALHLEVRFLPRALRRTRDTPQQAKLDKRARAANLEGAFVVAAPAEIRDRHVLLVDDVRTTGATLRACTGALRRAGAREVTTLVIARVEGDADR